MIHSILECLNKMNKLINNCKLAWVFQLLRNLTVKGFMKFSNNLVWIVKASKRALTNSKVDAWVQEVQSIQVSEKIKLLSNNNLEKWLRNTEASQLNRSTKDKNLI